MLSQPEKRMPGQICRRCLAAMLAFGLMGALTASGSTVSSALDRENPRVGHHCKCGMQCRVECCCAHDERAAATSKTPSSGIAIRTVLVSIADTSLAEGPCWNAFACGGAEPISPSATVRILDMAVLLESGVMPDVLAHGRLTPESLLCRPEIPPARLEEPPEPPGVS
jgi:hypothetical protein